MAYKSMSHVSSLESGSNEMIISSNSFKEGNSIQRSNGLTSCNDLLKLKRYIFVEF